MSRYPARCAAVATSPRWQLDRRAEEQNQKSRLRCSEIENENKIFINRGTKIERKNVPRPFENSAHYGGPDLREGIRVTRSPQNLPRPATLICHLRKTRLPAPGALRVDSAAEREGDAVRSLFLNKSCFIIARTIRALFNPELGLNPDLHLSLSVAPVQGFTAKPYLNTNYSVNTQSILVNETSVSPLFFISPFSSPSDIQEAGNTLMILLPRVTLVAGERLRKYLPHSKNSPFRRGGAAFTQNIGGARESASEIGVRALLIASRVSLHPTALSANDIVTHTHIYEYKNNELWKTSISLSVNAEVVLPPPPGPRPGAENDFVTMAVTYQGSRVKSLVAETQLDSEKKLKSKRGRLLECIQGNLQVLDKLNP
ncbi:hypothetical protein EVAR_17163_1 [Eumeta japonica]|uniref:Uncharacterized protein n=1 Tax=Eumeta variegata TaxID=151549 RepID=A0A4C1U916_EUMVA|nr:hypothetical protein EVAR_17163_1 [Eumeta japonica]